MSLLIQLLANVPGRRVEDSLSIWVPTTLVGDTTGGIAPCLQSAWVLAIVVFEAVNQQMEAFFL